MTLPETFSYAKVYVRFSSFPDRRRTEEIISRDSRLSEELSQVSLLFQLVASLKHFVPALNGRLRELLTLTQFLNYANITVLTLVALQRPVNRLSFFYVDDNHVRTIRLRAKTSCPFGEKIIKSIDEITALIDRSANLPGKGNNNIKTRQGKMNNPLLTKRSRLSF